jgi:hypothetical protein
VRGDASLDKIAPDDLGRDTHDDIVAHLEARDLFIELPGPAGNAPRPGTEGVPNASLARLDRFALVAVRIRHMLMLRRSAPRWIGVLHAAQVKAEHLTADREAAKMRRWRTHAAPFSP